MFQIPSVPTVTPQEAYEEIQAAKTKDAKALAVIDVRTAYEFKEGHIKGAQNIPFDKLLECAAKELTKKDIRILVYCAEGYLAAYAVEAMIKQAYTNVVSFGGIASWPYGLVRGFT